MTVTGEPPNPLSAVGDAAARPSRRRDGLAVREVCPYLSVDDGTWRSAYPSRDHRCGALQPPALLAVAKQRDLCLLPAHDACATFLAARAVAEESMPPPPGDDGASLWPAASAAPLVLEPARRMTALTPASARRGGSALVIVLMVAAFAVLVLSRMQSPSATASPEPTLAVVAASASAVPSVLPTTAPSRAATDDPPASASASAAPTEDPATPEPRRYRVRSGDTLSSIAARFDTTVRKLQAANEISDPRSLRIGQVLVIP